MILYDRGGIPTGWTFPWRSTQTGLVASLAALPGT